ncbi:MAG TPA: hypothetical protein VMZ52_14680 [Bryobacteraceae bacterium]|nr:hypothetical protein [Bryobacteraceae bacterium]
MSSAAWPGLDAALGNPTGAYLVMIIGLAGIYAELNWPGRVIPGVLGGVAAVAGLVQFAAWWSFFLAVPLVWAEAKLGWHGIAAGAVLSVLAIVQGVAPLAALALSFPFGWLTVALLKIALRAQSNKATL